MSNDIFNMNRFWRYFKTEFDAFVSRYGISLLVMSTMAVTTDMFNGLISFFLTGTWQGMIAPLRVMLFVIFATIVLMTSPAKLYGYVTDRKEGSAFLMLPASKLEKYISMVLISCVVVPFIFFVVYMGLDIMVCKIDGTCGISMFSMFTGAREFVDNFISGALLNQEGAAEMLNIFGNAKNAIFTPLLYVDDVIQLTLYFLLGALIFKSSKTGKTLGCIILLGLSLEVILTPVFALIGFNTFNTLSAAELNAMTPDQLISAMPAVNWTLHHVVLIDTLSDTLVNCLLLFFIWLRLKRIKH